MIILDLNFSPILKWKFNFQQNDIELLILYRFLLIQVSFLIVNYLMRSRSRDDTVISFCILNLIGDVII